MVIDPEYRVRGMKSNGAIRWVAQKRIHWLWFSWWWPLSATPHRYAEQAWHDVEYDQLAVPKTQYVKPERAVSDSKPPTPPKR